MELAPFTLSRSVESFKEQSIPEFLMLRNRLPVSEFETRALLGE
jgi:hypothetical protein